MVTLLVIGNKTDGPGSTSPSNLDQPTPDTDLALLHDPSHVNKLLYWMAGKRH